MENELKSLLNIDVRSLYEETINHEIAERYLTILQLCRCCHRHICRAANLTRYDYEDSKLYKQP